MAPDAILNDTYTYQGTEAVIPSVLLMLMVANVGELVELMAGAIVPLKFTTPVEALDIELTSLMVCTLVPVKVATPLLVRVPLLVKSPSRMAVLFPKFNEPVVSINRSPAIETVPLVTV